MHNQFVMCMLFTKYPGFIQMGVTQGNPTDLSPLPSAHSCSTLLPILMAITVPLMEVVAFIIILTPNLL